ncbi:putative secreted protein, partial [Listeria innocua FSL S4-378]
EKTPDLGKYTDDFKAAVKQLSDAYKLEADALKASGRDTTKADEAMAKADEAIAGVLKDAGLNPSSITTDTAS